MNVRTYYYNTAPRGVQSRDNRVVAEEIARKGTEIRRKEDEPLPQRSRWQIAGRILDTYM